MPESAPQGGQQAWALRLAEAVAPDEIDLAPAMVDAFVAGGRARRQLFPQSGPLQGGVIAGDVQLVVPTVLVALQAAGPWLLEALASPAVSNITGAIKNGLGIIELREKAARHAADARSQTVPGDPTAVPHAEADVLLSRIVQSMKREFEAMGMDRDQRDALVLRTLSVLFEDPTSAAAFVQALTRRT
jgi:hypothetical protein